ncbi:hypothetical protein F5Y17DRAFT_166167 [Xylariaceae sp. FL0594]|nr:hypothetical protein F5Y17DRAFT_166167 [Xylariaceae sp. FL0594]
MFPSVEASYTVIPGSTARDPIHRGRFRISFRQTTFFILTVLLSILVGFFGAIHVTTPRSNNNKRDAMITFASVSQTFIYNRSFSYPPSEATDRAWDEIFPAGGTFFPHPTNISERATFSVYHQLHCLNGLSKGYWANQIAASRGETLSDGDLPMDLRASHMRHCIDLLRQSLMCNGDTTLEVVDKALGGVKAFGTEHASCLDWNELREWTVNAQKGESLID